MARFDIVMPVRNGARYIGAALDGIAAQDVRDWRLLVLDHGSTDKTVEIVSARAEKDPRIELIDGSAVKGLSALRNYGFDLCDCEFVVLHDADDVSQPYRLSSSLSAFDAHPSVLAVGGQANVVDAEGRRVGFMSRYTDIDRISASAIFCNPIAQPTVSLRFAGLAEASIRYGTDILGTVYPPGQQVIADLVEDYLLFGQLAITNRYINTRDVVLDYRVHGANVSVVGRARQTQLSLFVSRFLMHSLSQLTGAPYVDPAPFCNHGGQLVSLPGDDRDLQVEFDNLAKSLTSALGPSVGLRRELDYRRVLSTRSSLGLALNYARFRTRHRPQMDEAAAIRDWYARRLRGGDDVRAEAEAEIAMPRSAPIESPF